MILPVTVTVDKKDEHFISNKEVISSPLNNGYQDSNNTQNLTFNNQWNDWNNQQNSQFMSKPNSNESNIKNSYYTNESIPSRNVYLNSNKTEINNPEEQEFEPDYFKDMTPELRKPKKVCSQQFSYFV